VLFSAAYRQNNGLLALWRLSDVELTTSQFALDEAARNLADDDQRRRLYNLASKVTIVPPPSPPGSLPPDVALPDKDAPILLAAMASGATHLLTGDKKHFGPLFGQTISGVLIQPPADYLRSRLRK
jgi:hypothetical protein